MHVATPYPVLAGLALSAACVLPNPGFDPDTSASATLSTTVDRGSEGDSSPDDPTTDPGGLVSSTDTDGTTGTTGTTGTGVTSGTMGTTTSTETDDGPTETATDSGEAQDCWDAPADVWSVSPLPDAKLGIKPVSPHVSPDGLSLYYLAAQSEGEERPIHKSTRASLDEDFKVGEPMVLWPGFPHAFDHANVTLDETEIILAVMVGAQPRDVGVTALDEGVFAPPLPFVGAPNTLGHNEDIATVSEDGSRMIVQRDDGPGNGLVPTTWTFVELERPAYPAPGTPFGAEKGVTISPITDVPGHVILCPAISPDGLHLFFGSTHPLVLGPDSSEVLRVFSTERATLDGPWESPVEITSLADDDPNYDFETCPTSVTRDGCQLFVHRFQFGDVVKAEDSYRIVVATRTP